MLEKKVLGRLNTDDADRDLEVFDIRDCLNLIPQLGGKSNSSRRESLDGTVKIDTGLHGTTFTLPSGTNTTVGQFEDKSRERVFFFNHNSNNTHGVYVYYPLENQIAKLIEDSVLKFTTSTVISGAGIVDETLVWTDGIEEIRSLDVQTALNSVNSNPSLVISNTKILKGRDFQLVFDRENILGQSITIAFNNEDSSTTPIVLSTIATEDDIDNTLDTWVSEINTAVPGTPAERCNDSITITEKVYTAFNQIKSISSSNSSLLVVTPTNFYPAPYIERDINLINQPRLCGPTAFVKDDATINLNFINETPFQFRSKYSYHDDTQSVLSPISDIVFSRNCDPDTPNKANLIEITFNDLPYTVKEMAVIKSVDLYFREGNLGVWKKMVTLRREDYFTGKFKFYNNGNYNPIGDLEANKLFDAIPNKANSLAILKNRLFLGGVTEGRETPCIEASLDTDIDDAPVDPPTWTIEGFLRIANTFNDSTSGNQPDQRKGRVNQCIWHQDASDLPQFGAITNGYLIESKRNDVGVDYKQLIPQGGFTVFLAGTNHNATTKQVYNRDGTLADLNNNPVIYVFDGSEIRSLMSADKCYQKFSIKGVKPGRYRLRVASHLVYKGDVHPAISSFVDETYQINTTNLWQETSTHLRIINQAEDGVTPSEHSITLASEKITFKHPKGSQEIEIELDENGGVYDVNAVTGSVMVIDDLSYPFSRIGVPPLSAGAVDAYIVDTGGGGSTNIEDFIEGKTIEGCDVQVRDKLRLAGVSLPAADLNNLPITSPVFKSDHNGYFYSSRVYNEVILGISQISHVREVEITSSNDTVCSFRENNIIFDKDAESGGISDLLGADKGYNIGNVKDGTVANGGTEKTLVQWSASPLAKSDMLETKQVIIFASSASIRTNGRTLLRGTLLDIEGRPISDALVTMNGTNKTDLTDSEGNYAILVYSETSPSEQKNGNIFINAISDCLIDSSPLDPLKKIAISIIINSGNFNNGSDNFFPVGTSSFGNIKNIGNSTFLKRGGIYQWGLEYLDDYLRSSLVSTRDILKVNIPFYTEDLHDFFPEKYPNTGTFKFGDPTVSWEIKSIPPSWATRYRWVRTKNTAYNNYLHWIANDIKYVKNFDTDADLSIDTTFAAGDATEIYIGLGNILTYQEENSDSQIGYTFNEGDRIILVKNDGTFYTEYLDFEVRAQRGNFVVIEALLSLSELKEGLQFQIYTPKLQNESDVYYEVSRCYEIIGGFHEGQTQNQTASLPAKGSFSDGDTYKINRTIPTENTRVNITLDSEHISDSVTTKDSNIGRPNIEDLNFKTVDRFATIRFSNQFIQSSFVNGIKTFDALDEEDLPYERGTIRKLVGTSNVVVVIHETETTSLYISEAFLHTAEGSGTLTKVDKVIGDERLLKGEFGTINPESVVEYDDVIYWWDANKAEPVRYSNNGLTPLGSNLKMKELFISKEQDRKAFQLSNPNAINRVYGGYNPIRNYYMISFNDLGDGKPDTIVFNEESNYWLTRLSVIPQHFSKLANIQYSFNNGELWEHDKDTVNQNTFYGVHFDALFEIISNLENDAEKIYRNLSIVSNKKWDVTKISNREGQLSSLVKNSFVQRDNAFYADILRDENTNVDQLVGLQTPRLHGHVMRSQIMKFNITTDETGKIFIENIFVGFQSSPGHLLDNSQ